VVWAALVVYVYRDVDQDRSMLAWPLNVSKARNCDMQIIVRLIQEASDWLRTKDTDQWARPWPDRNGLHDRIQSAIHRETTWICWDGATPAATITADLEKDPHWSETNHTDPAIYIHRLVVSRMYAGEGLGAALLDWAGFNAKREHGARWIRVSAWTSNFKLHAYYRGQGFSLIGFNPDSSYPSGARFEKSTAYVSPASLTPFRQI
jgi:GNAT superfamily N-acetyltransferase